MLSAGRIIAVSACVVTVAVAVVTHGGAGTLRYDDFSRGRYVEIGLHRGHLRFAYCVHTPSEYSAEEKPYIVLTMIEPERCGQLLKKWSRKYRGEYQESEFPVWPLAGIVLVLTAAAFRRRTVPTVRRGPAVTWRTLRVLSGVAACAVIALGIRSMFYTSQIAWIDVSSGHQFGLTACDARLDVSLERMTQEYLDLCASVDSDNTPSFQFTDWPPNGGLDEVNWRSAGWFTHEENETAYIHQYGFGFPMWIPAVLMLLPLRPWELARKLRRAGASRGEP